uniref:Pentatricopeptide repeat-containing protein n=1 Tax=Brassica campestris TaxID=3711 RepID=M4CR65_BRACM
MLNRILCQGRKLHAHLVTSDAGKVFDEMPKRDISRCVVMFGACARNGYYQESLDTFREMNEEGIVELAAQRLAELELDNSGMDCFYPVCTPMVVVGKVL